MSFFAEIDEDNIVLQVIVMDDERGESFCREITESSNTWIQTYMVGGTRKNYAGIGDFFDTERDAFIPPRPFESWNLNEETCLWNPPVPCPVSDKEEWIWDEESVNWIHWEPTPV
jgi:hypothetical protein